MKNGELSVGDDIIITGPTTGIVEHKVSHLRLEEQDVESVKRGDSFTFKIEDKIRPADKVYKIVDA